MNLIYLFTFFSILNLNLYSQTLNDTVFEDFSSEGPINSNAFQLDEANNLVVIVVQDNFCNNNGIIEVSPPSTITPPFSINVTYPNGIVFNSIFSTDVFTLSGLAGGIYDISVSSNNDTVSSSVELLENTLSTNFYSPSFANGGYNISCYALCDASLAVNVFNTSESYTIDWFQDSVFGTPFYSTESSSSLQSDLCAGEYFIRFTSSSGCESTRSYVIREPDNLYVDGYSGEEFCGQDPNGFIEIDVFGGVGNTINNSTGQIVSFIDYSFSWSGPNGFTSSQEDISFLESGSYNLLVEDNNGCSFSSSFTVEDNIQSLELIGLNSEDPECNGSSDGSLEVLAIGGQPPYNYRISGWAWQSSGIFTSLPAGIYLVEVIDDNNCTDSFDIFLENPEVSNSETIVESCDSYFWNGEIYTESDIYTFATTNSAGCDSTATLNLTINSSITSSEVATSCLSFDWNGEVYTESGVYTYATTNSVGCDSTAALNLTINTSSSSFEETSACDSYVWNGEVYTESGVYNYATINSVGCDSTATLSLTINTSSSSFEEISACGSYVWNGEVYTESGVYTYATINSVGCDSTATLNLTINNSITLSEEVTSCLSFDWNGITYTESGTYTYSSTNLNGCDSTATLSLTINMSSTSSEEISACGSYVWNGDIYTESGIYTYATINSVGCDSTATLNLTINTSSSSSEETSVCNSYVWNGEVYTESGVYAYTTTNSVGCDSTAILNLTVNTSSSSPEEISVCGSYVWNGEVYTESGVYSYATTNSVGCDSTATLNLTVNTSSSSSEEISACGSYVWNGDIYTESGIYTYATINSVGCDSTATLNLTINTSSSSSEETSVCNSYVWNGEVYTESGVYAYTTTNSVGCDSTAILNLTVNTGSSSSEETSACDSFIWNGNTYTESGVYTYATTNSVGCDSTAILSLTINNSTTSLEEASSCLSFVWNGVTYTESGTYTYSSTNLNGCDSTAILELDICYLENLEIFGTNIATTNTLSSYVILNNNIGSIYNWSLSEDIGFIYSGQFTNEIYVDWVNVEGVTTICVVENYNCSGYDCLGDTACLDVTLKKPSSIIKFDDEVLSIYPNPFKNYSTVNFFNPKKSKANLKLMDTSGRIVREYNGINSNNITIKKEELSQGLYYIQLNLNNKITRRPIVIQ